jgi:YesN/AraC family two-component response regulator
VGEGMGEWMDDEINVLIVDDNEDARGYILRVLTFEADIIVVAEATNGLEAVQLVQELQPHVVLMDLNMPVMDGITACGEMKRIAPATQVIILSVQDDAGPMREAIDSGASAFLIKPVDPEDLIDLLHRAYTAYTQISPYS